jgi:dienelactone hydrolase
VTARARLLALLLVLVACGASDESRAEGERAQDVRLAAAHLRDDHPNLFHDLSPARFEAEVDSLAARADSLGDDELLVGLMRLAALPGVRDGHTGIFPLDPSGRRVLHMYPIRLYTFADGTYVVGQVGGSDLLRARLLAVAGRPLADVARAVSPLVPRDNDSTLRLRVNTFLNTAEVLHGLGIAPDTGTLGFAFERDGSRFDANLAPIPLSRYAAGIGDLVHPLIPQGIVGRAPAYVARRNQSLWTTKLGARRVFYLGYNDARTGTWTAGRRTLAAAKTKRLRGVIVDLRNNPGGDNGTYVELLDALRRASRTERVVAILSRTTFSAAENFAAELERVARPTFVGERSGGSPNLYGDVVSTPLPVSGVTLHVASIYWQKSTADDPRVAIEPQVPVALTSGDFFAGRDPVLAAAIATALAPRALAAAPRPRFSYDRSRPLALRLGTSESSGGVVRQALSFDAGLGRKAGYWIHPAGSGPWPVVLFSPGSDGDATSQLLDAERLARRGIASLTVAPPRLLVSCRAAADVRAYSNYVVGRRRALDLVTQLPGADRSRVAAVGFSFGAAVTATLAGVDHRLRGAVIQSGRAHLSTPIGTFCRRLGARRLKAYVRAYTVIDPVRYVGRAAPAALLFQNGTQDPISPRTDVDALVRAARSPKEQRWYDAGHSLNAPAQDERDDWLVRLLRA